MARRRFFHTVVFRMVVGLAVAGLALSIALALLQIQASEAVVEGVFLAFMTLLCLLVLRRWVTAPLARMMDLIRANAGAEPFRTVAGQGKDEFAQLAEAIAGMLGRLESTAGQLRQSQAAFQSLYQQAPAAMVSLNPQGQIVAANRRAAELLGASSEESLGGSMVLDFVRPEDRALLRQTIERLPLDAVSRCALRLGVGRPNPDVMVEGAAVRDHNGELLSVRLSLLDVSASKKLERQLGDKTRLLNLILDHISDAILLVDVDGQVAAYNRQLARLLGARGDQLIGTRYDPQTFWDELGVVEKRLFVDRLAQIETDASRPAQERFVTRSGAFLFQGIPVRDPTGLPLGRLWVAQEITSQEQSQKLLEQQSGQLRALLEVSCRLSGVSDVETLMTLAGDYLYEVLQIEAVGLALRRDQRGSRSRQIVHCGTAPVMLEAGRELVAAVERQLMPQVLAGQEVLFWPDLNRGTGWGQAFLRAGLTCLAAGPIRGSADAQGILWIARRGGEHIGRQHLYLLEALAPIIAARVEIAQLRERLDALELTDLVTHLPNQRHLLFEVHKLVHRPGHPWSLVVLKLDHFRQLNSLMDHQTADRLLKHVATVLQQDTRKSSLVARLSGSTFAVLCPGGTRKQSTALAERLRLLIRQQEVVLPDGSRQHLTASVGVAAAPEDWGAGGPGTGEALVDLAQARVEAAKRAGRDRVVAEGVTPDVHQRAAG